MIYWHGLNKLTKLPQKTAAKRSMAPHQQDGAHLTGDLLKTTDSTTWPPCLGWFHIFQYISWNWLLLHTPSILDTLWYQEDPRSVFRCFPIFNPSVPLVLLFAAGPRWTARPWCGGDNCDGVDGRSAMAAMAAMARSVQDQQSGSLGGNHWNIGRKKGDVRWR